ncbi:nucleotide sugar dehydrogenase [Verrucomicrobiales bacterium BCK34]|nr:nucleotide sugar dehydrogenase [Verrucomicrobiales bacterium BCK34]
MKIAIAGLGYVGLPLARQFVRGGIDVIGLDVDKKKVDTLKAGQTYIKHIPAEEINEMVSSGHFEPTTDFSSVNGVDAILICVPTPLSKQREPDLSYVIATAEGIAPHLSKGTLVTLESTTYPGTTDGELREALEKGSGMTAGVDFYLAYSPEREDPGNKTSVEAIPKLVGGLTDTCRDRALEVYRKAIDSIVPVASCRVAEAAKLTENIFRSVNIAMVNELKVIFDRMEIDVWDVIDAAATKPFGYMPFYPGPGLGGHCIPIDPFYLTWKAREFGKHTRFIELAGEINNSMPEYVITRLGEALNSVAKPVRNSKILVVGLAYKAGVDDMRESPSFQLLDLIKNQGGEVSYYDPYIPEVSPTREHAEWTGARSITWDAESLSKFDAAIVSTDHPDVDYQLLADNIEIIIDTRNAFEKAGVTAKSFWKA